MKTVLLVFYIIIAISIAVNVFLETLLPAKLKDIKVTKSILFIGGSILVGILFPILFEALLVASIYRCVKDNKEEEEKRKEEFEEKCEEMEQEEDGNDSDKVETTE